MDKFMKLAFMEAQKAYKIDEVPVGAVIVKNGVVISKGYNLREKKQSVFGHAEMICIEKASKKLNSWKLDGCEMYVTLEPCAMCAGAITQARISKVYFGAYDEKNGCIGSVTNILETNITHKAKYECVCCKECSSILTEFFKELRIKKNKI